MPDTRSKRNANIELLRIISILMVTMLHALGKSNLLGNLSQGTDANTWIAWIFEALSISAVNIFMLISGYYLIKAEFRLSRMVELIVQIVFFTFGSFIVFYLLGFVGKEEIDVYWFLNYLLPVHMDVFWFMTAYLVIYALQPVLSKGIEHISKKKFVTLIVILLVFECAFKSFLPFRMYTDSKGYSFLWCLVVFLTGAYLRIYGFKILNSSLKGIFLYLGSCLAILLESFLLSYSNNILGRLKEISGMSTEYNNIFVFTAAIGIFAAFIHAKPMKNILSNIICFVSPMTLGVYLLQENLTMRYRWQPWFKLSESASAPTYLFIARVLLAVISMYLLGIVVDYARIWIFKGVKTLFSLIKK